MLAMSGAVNEIGLQPTRTVTPSTPSSRPIERLMVKHSPNHIVPNVAAQSGTVALSIAAIDAVSCNSAAAINAKGIAAFRAPRAINFRACSRSDV